MNNKLSALLTSAIVTGLLAATAAKAEETAPAAQGNTEEMAAAKHGCKGEKAVKKAKKGQKTACTSKSGCDQSKMKEEKKGE